MDDETMMWDLWLSLRSPDDRVVGYFLNALFNDSVICEGYIAAVVDEWICIIGEIALTEENTEVLGGKNLSQCRLFHHKSHEHWRGKEPGPLQWEAGD